MEAAVTVCHTPVKEKACRCCSQLCNIACNVEFGRFPRMDAVPVTGTVCTVAATVTNDVATALTCCLTRVIVVRREQTMLTRQHPAHRHLLPCLPACLPGVVFRGMVIAAQAVFFSAFAASYMINPKFCHAFVGYLEEEAVKTYTQALQEIDAGRLWPGKPAPPIACYYWGLPEGASMRQLVLAVRADEAHHSHVNHTFARLPQDGPNPFDKKDSHLVP
eukprot:GHRQ01013615.1.p1 GENE.GHRQ01013615.1~~GHRQ01013615.1.p1  ORF type:complete len:219 (+),score=83.84 GHRQ01013615.1:210-866(+)